MPEIAIHVENLSKQYRIGAYQKNRNFREAIMEVFASPFRGVGRILRGQGFAADKQVETILALKNVSLEIKQGEVVGIIGRNGGGVSDGQVTPLRSTGVPVGLVPNGTWSEAEVVLPPGGSIVFYTDGLTEAENDEGVEFSVDNIKTTLVPLHGRPSMEIVALLKRAVLRFTNVQSLADDLTLVVVGRNPAA